MAFKPWETIEKVGGQDLSAFKCGMEKFDSWLKNEAESQQKQGRVTTWLAIAQDGEVVGYFSLRHSVFTARNLDLSKTQERKLGIEDGVSSGILIAKLALHEKWQGKGYGLLLLDEALTKCVQVFNTAAYQLIMVDAASPKLVSFYEERGFFPSGENLRLINTVRTAASQI
ncbi:GNAT family N-acetyltransferase [Varibaculum cambriense]|uniref:GNAT family N-acetyltransferase n=1 Tax=Varibaculum cambriense TaxID=184870 RepID=UPI00242C0EAD|nr:GNAT family N-acetyltransferase [Varibaculum cambriense]